MFRKFKGVVMALTIAAMVMLSGATPVFAAVDTHNLAGRPINGNAATSCHGVSYGRLDGVLVLWSAAHCASPGATVYGPNGTAIGYWGGVMGGDLASIKLYSGNWPSVLNKVYSNNGSGGFTINADPSSALRCANFAAYTGVSMYQAFQTSATSTYGTNNGVAEGTVEGACSSPVNTTIPQHTCCGYKDSGSPVFLAGNLNTVFGVGSVWWDNNGTHDLAFTTVYDSLNIIRNDLTIQHTATLCHTASC